MKRFLTLLIALVMLLSLTGCISDLKNVEIPPMPVNTPEPAGTPEPLITPEPVATINSRVIIYTEREASIDLDPEYGAVVILDFKCDTPKVFIEGNQAASDKINAYFRDTSRFNLYTDGEVGTVYDKRNELRDLATSYYETYAYQEGAVVDFSCRFSRTYDVIRADDSVIAFTFTNTQSQFGGEDVTEEETYYFDAKTGEEIDNYTANEEGYPKAEKNGTGTIGVLPLSGANSTDRSIIDQIVTTEAEEAEDFVIYADGIIYDVVVNDDNNGVCWYCNVMNNSSVQLKAVLPEGFPEILVSYTSEGKMNNYLFARDLDKGGPVLADFESVTAVG